MATKVTMWLGYFSRSTTDAASIPAQTVDRCSLRGTAKPGPKVTDNQAHTEWSDGKCQPSGVTTTAAPNTQVSCRSAGANDDVGWVGVKAGGSLTASTNAAITARSDHADIVHVAWMDGSLRTVTDGVDLVLWRAMSTRAGSEVVEDDGSPDQAFEPRFWPENLLSPGLLQDNLQAVD
jgi:hypothetical protein